jgi:hypothetical protein
MRGLVKRSLAGRSRSLGHKAEATESAPQRLVMGSRLWEVIVTDIASLVFATNSPMKHLLRLWKCARRVPFLQSKGDNLSSSRQFSQSSAP